MRPRTLGTPRLIGCFGIVKEQLCVANIHGIVILSVLGIRVRVAIFTQKFLHIVTRSRGITHLVQAIIVASGRDIGFDSFPLYLPAIMDNVHIEGRWDRGSHKAYRHHSLHDYSAMG